MAFIKSYWLHTEDQYGVKTREREEVWMRKRELGREERSRKGGKGAL